MIETVWTLGRAFLPEVPVAPPYPDLSPDDRRALGILVERPAVGYVLDLVFDPQTGAYQGIGGAAGVPTDPFRLLYRERRGTGGLNVPGGILTARRGEATETAVRRLLTNRFLPWLHTLEETVAAAGLDAPTAAFLARWRTAFQNACPQIAADLRRAITPRLREDGVYVTVRFGELPPGDPTLPFARIFLARHRLRLFTPTRRHPCALCRTVQEVSGRAAAEVFPFATVDKPGYISGLDPRLAWRMFPLCFACYLLLVWGRRVIDERLTMTVSGFSFWRVPEFLPTVDPRPILAALAPTTGRPLTMGRRSARLFTLQEDTLTRQLAATPTVLTVHMIALRRTQSREQVELLASDVPPTRLRRLYDAKERVWTLGVTAGWLDALDAWDYTFESALRPFFPLLRPYLDTVNACLRGEPVNGPALLPLFRDRLRSRLFRFRHRAPFRRAATDAFFTILFLAQVGVWRWNIPQTPHAEDPVPPERKKMREIMTDPFGQEVAAFFDAHAAALPTPACRYAYLVGALTACLLTQQRKRYHGREPFRERLRAFFFTLSDLDALFRAVTAKFSDYGDMDPCARRIQTLAADYRLAITATETRTASVDLLSNAFAFGLAHGERVFWTIYKTIYGENGRT